MKTNTRRINKRMFAEQRYEKIKEVLLQYKHAEVSSLSSILSVSEATIRRDLEKLEQQGFLKRTHGGAVLENEQMLEPILLQEDTKKSDEMNYIAKIASQLIEDNEIIIIGTGMIGLYVARHLSNKKDITIVTNNNRIATELSNNKEIKVILTGGETVCKDGEVFTIGEFTLNMLEDIHVSKAFLSVRGIDLNFGYTTNDMAEALVWKKMKEVADETIILSEAEAFDKKGFVKLAPIDSVSKIVTSSQVDDKYKNYYFEKGIPIYTSYNL